MEDYSQYWPIFLFALNGFIAGWLASRLFGGLGFIRNLVVGMAGSVLAGYAIRSGIVAAPPIFGTALIDQIAYSTIGAVVIILVARLISR